MGINEESTASVSDSIQVSTGKICMTSGDTFGVYIGSGSALARNSGFSEQVFIDIQEVSSSNTLTGTFEQIASTSLIMVSASGNGGEIISSGTDPIPYISEAGSHSDWNGDTLTTSQAGRFKFEATAMFSSQPDGRSFRLYKSTDGGTLYNPSTFCTGEEPIGLTKHLLSCSIDLEIGDKVQIRDQIIGGQLFNQAEYHYLKITQLPSGGDLVKNLNTDSNTKCQTKHLITNIITNDTYPELSFSNLTIGNKYSIESSLTGGAFSAGKNKINAVMNDGINV